MSTSDLADSVRPPNRCAGDDTPRAYTEDVSNEPADSTKHQHLELRVEELLRRARPLPPHEEMALDDLGEDEGAAFLAAVESSAAGRSDTAPCDGAGAERGCSRSR